LVIHTPELRPTPRNARFLAEVRDPADGPRFADARGMKDKRLQQADRRRTSRSGRRTSDPTPASVGTAVRTSATLLWELPDETRCWMMRHRGRVIVHVSRGAGDLRIEIFATEVDAKTGADALLMEFGAVEAPVRSF
jgi:hypothetical protein